MKNSYHKSHAHTLCLAVLSTTGLCHGAEILTLSSQLEQFSPSITQKIDEYRATVAQITNFNEWEFNDYTLVNKDAFAQFLGYQQWLQMPFEGGEKFEGYTEQELEKIYNKIVIDMQVVVIKSLWNEHSSQIEESRKNIIDDNTEHLVEAHEFLNAFGQFLSDIKFIVIYMKSDLYKILRHQLSIMTKADDPRAVAWQDTLIQAVSTALAVSSEWEQRSSKSALKQQDHDSLSKIFQSYHLALREIENMITEMHQPLIPYDEATLNSSLSHDNTKEFIKELAAENERTKALQGKFKDER